MNKVICDICGTSYPETADQCPICGCARDFKIESLTDDLLEDEFLQDTAEQEEKVASAAGSKPLAGDKNLFLDEEYEEDDDEDDEDDDDDDDDDDDEEHNSNAPLVILLVIVILALVAVSGFIFVKYFMPNVLPQETTQAPQETTTAPVETTELTIPCENLALTSGGDVVLGGEGANWLINVLALPENTTDELIYTSSDESVVTVDAQGKVTAVGEGTAVITITCGAQELKCTVTCDFTPETTAPAEPEETTVPEDAADPEETTESTEPEETTQPTEPLKDITLKVSLTDLTFNAPNQGYTFKVNGLANNEVKWTSMDENVVTVDENGNVISVGRGNTTIICQYGDQKVEIKIRCSW